MLDALRVKKIAYSVLGLLSAFSVALGAFCSPATAYAMSAGAMGDINNSTYYEYDLSVLEPFCYGNAGSHYIPFDFYGKNTDFAGLNPSYYNLLFVPMPFGISEGDIINVKGNFRFSTGSIEMIRFCLADEGGTTGTWDLFSVTNSVTLSDWENSSYGVQFSTYGQSVVASRDATQCYLVFCITIEPSSRDWFMMFTNLSFSIAHNALYEPDFEDVKDKQDEQTSILGVISSSISSLASGIANLLSPYFGSVASSISYHITRLYDFVVTLPQNIASVFSSFFDSVVSAVNGVAQGVANALSGAFNILTTAVNGVAQGVANALSGAFNTLTTSVNGVAQGVANALSGAFNTLTTAVNGVAQSFVDGISDFFELILGTDVLDGSYFEQFENQWGLTSDEINDALSQAPDIFQPSGEYLPNIGDFIPFRDNPFFVLMSRFFDFDFVENAFGCAVAFGTLGYIVFGKR